MATFLNGVTDAQPQQHLYQPDYQFLTSVMGMQQQKYDDGFAKVKTVYNSLFSMPISHAENEEWRSGQLRQLETQMRAVSKVDLSQGANVVKAKGLFDPLIKDKDLMSDLSLTAQYGSASAQADQAQHSTDPEIRKTYSDLSRRDIQNGMIDLKSAKRGDGSMQRVRMNGFTAFANTDEYLAKQAAEQKLEIVRDSSKPGGYLLKTTNGAGAAPAFAQWAKSMLGTQFDSQFQVEARVKTEDAIRGAMQAGGLDRATALNQIVQKVHPGLLQKAHSTVEVHSQELDTLTTTLAAMKQDADAHGGIRDSIKPQYIELVAKRKELEAGLRNAQTDVKTLSSADATTYLTGNLQALLTDDIKNETATRWAGIHALATEKTEVRGDDVYKMKYEVSNTNMRHSQDLSQARSFKNMDHSLAVSKFQFEVGKDGRDYANANDHFDTEEAGRQQTRDIAAFGQGINLLKTGKGGATGKAGAAGAGLTAIAAYTAPGQTTSGVDVISKHANENFGKMMSNSFGTENGLVNLLFPDQGQLTAVHSLANKLKDMRNGVSGTSFTPEDATLLRTLGKSFNMEVAIPTNGAYAQQLLMNLTMAMSKKADRLLNQDHGQITQAQKQAARIAVASVKGIQTNYQQINAQQEQTSAHMLDENGQLKDQYREAKFLFRGSKGQPVYDPSTIKDAATRASLDLTVNQHYLDQARLSGTSYNIPKVGENELKSILTGNNQTQIRVDGQVVSADYLQGKAGWATALANTPGKSQLDAIGNTGVISVDPASGTSTFTFQLDGTAGMASKANGNLLPKQGKVEITMSNEKVLGTPALERFHQTIQAHAPRFGAIATLMELDKGKTGRAPASVKQEGLDFIVSQVDNGSGPQIRIKYTVRNPVTQEWESQPQVTLIEGTMSQPAVQQQTNDALEEMYRLTTAARNARIVQLHAQEKRTPTAQLPR